MTSGQFGGIGGPREDPTSEGLNGYHMKERQYGSLSRRMIRVVVTSDVGGWAGGK